MSNNLEFQTLTTSQTNKEAAVNTALGQVDGMLTEVLTFEIDNISTTVTPVTLNWQRYRMFRIEDSSGSPPTTADKATLDLTNIVNREFVIHNDSTLPLRIGTTTLWVPVGATKVFIYDGTTMQEVDRDPYADFNHPPVRAASTANVATGTLNSGDSFDGVTLNEGDIVLLKNQTTASQNGLYLVGNTSSARVWWLPTGTVMEIGTTIPILEGTFNKGIVFKLAANATLDTDDPVFVPTLDRLFVAGAYFAGTVAGATKLWQFVVTDPFQLPVSLTGSQGFAGTAPSGGTAVFTINKNGASIGSLSFADAATTCTFTFASAVSFAAGDRIDITSAASLNGVVDVSVSLKGLRL